MFESNMTLKHRFLGYIILNPSQTSQVPEPKFGKFAPLKYKAVDISRRKKWWEFARKRVRMWVWESGRERYSVCERKCECEKERERERRRRKRAANMCWWSSWVSIWGLESKFASHLSFQTLLSPCEKKFPIVELFRDRFIPYVFFKLNKTLHPSSWILTRSNNTSSFNARFLSCINLITYVLLSIKLLTS